MKALWLSLILPIVTSLTLPEFDDPYFGTLIVSQKKFPFLTSKQRPDLAHVFPNDLQLANISAAVKHQILRAKRGAEANASSADTSLSGFLPFMNILSKLLKFEFGHVLINKTVIDHGLSFDKIHQDAYFMAIHMDKSNFVPYLENEFNGHMRNLTKTKKPWFPAEDVIQKMRQCQYFKYASVGDEDFKRDEKGWNETLYCYLKFESYNKETGGVIVYYKLTCVQVEDTYYLLLSIYDNVYSLTDIRHEEIYQSSFKFLFFESSETEVRTWFEKKYISLDEVQRLLEYIMASFAKRLRLEYRQYFENADGHPSMIK